MRKAVCIALLISLILGTNVSTIAARRQTKSQVRAQTKAKSKASVRSKPKPKPRETFVPYQACILVEADTGQILYEEGAHKKWPPASMAKMMLTLIVVEKVKEGSIKLTDFVTVSEQASKIGGSQVHLKVSEVFTLEELIKAVLIVSANDAATAVAEYVAGSVEGFIQLMNERAKALKMNDTQYFNVHGLPLPADQQGNVSTAFDTAILARELLKYSDVLRWTSTHQTKFRNDTLTLTNTNRLIGNFPGADGLKTGYISKSGFNLTATALRDDMRLIAVVMGGASSRIRFQEAANLLSTGFDTYQKFVVLKKDQPFGQALPVKKGNRRSIRPIMAEDAVVVIKKGAEKGISLQPNLPALIEAPINKGQEVGKVSVQLANCTLATFPLVAPEDVPKHWFWRLFDFK